MPVIVFKGASTKAKTKITIRLYTLKNKANFAAPSWLFFFVFTKKRQSKQIANRFILFAYILQSDETLAVLIAYHRFVYTWDLENKFFPCEH